MSDALPARVPDRSPRGRFRRARGPFLTSHHDGTPMPIGSGPRRGTRGPGRQQHPHERRNPHS
ncbi:hypothetical protein B9W64_05060 [Streptomyces sp. CS159]|nr:hypothetical protein B9W64_05060 [Streptomyces sp. CS159]